MQTRFIALTILAIFALAAAVVAAPRQGFGTAGEKTNHAGMVQQLGLSQDQVQRIKTTVQGYHQAVADVVKSTAARQDKVAQIRELRTKAIADIDAVLAPDQLAKAKEMRIPERLLSFRHHKGMEMRSILSQLNLTEPQKAQVKQIMEDAHAQGQSIKNDTNLTQDQKMVKFRELRQTTLDKVKAVLTPDQLTKFNQLLQNRPRGWAVPGRQGTMRMHPKTS